MQICLEIDRTKCPKHSSGSVPNCKCEEGYKLDHIHWYCRAWYLNDTRGYIDGHIQTCPTFTVWDGTNCQPIRCPNDRTRLYPNCTEYERVVPRVSCPVGQNYTLEKPYCHCPNDLDYTYPVCHERCALNSTYFS